MDEYDYLFKIVVVGAKGSGKTSLVKRFVSRSWSDTPPRETPCVDFNIVTVVLGSAPSRKRTVKLHIWDVSGDPMYSSEARSYLNPADGVLAVVDAGSPSIASDANVLVDTIRGACPRNPDIAIVATKCDVEGRPPNGPWTPTSAKTGNNVDSVFEDLCARIELRTAALDGGRSPGADDATLPLLGEAAAAPAWCACCVM